MEVLPNIHQFAIPIPINPLGTVNAYLLTSPEGCILIDVGWNAPESFDSMMRHLAEAGASLADLKYIVITHIHPDHYGLIGRVHEHTDARLVMHEIERSLLDSRYVHYEQLLESMDEWLRINGVPDDNRQKLAMGSLEVLGLVSVALPDLPVRGGEHLVLGDFDLEVIWTPGHSPGHICLWDAKRRVLFSGDHILEKITPNVSMHTQTHGNPLVDYRSSLQQIAKLPVKMVLPGHGDPFGRCAERIVEMRHHHERRLNELRALCVGKPKTAYEVAAGATWYRDWSGLPPFTKRAAVTETLSHLELLLARKQVVKTMRRGMFWYLAVNHED